MYHFFEKQISPYPEGNPLHPSPNLLVFLWQTTQGTRFFLILLVVFSACYGAMEAIFFAILAELVNWLSHIEPSKLWLQEKNTLLITGIFIFVSTLIVALQSIIKHQCLAANLPMRIRWNLHRLVLSQGIQFFHDEFAGRLSAKLMQTATAVRDTCFLIADILVFAFISFITMSIVLAHLDPWLLFPFILWVVCYLYALYYFVPKLGNISSEQADARSMMTGRITDAYTNIMTVKLFSHTHSEASYAKESMDHFLVNANKQMRLISSFEIVNHLLCVLLILSTSGLALWLWIHDIVGIGGVAASIAMTLRLNGLSHWILWEMTALFENIGVVRDGINTFSISNKIPDKVDALPLQVTKGKIEFKQLYFRYGKKNPPVIRDFNLLIESGEKIGLVGRSGAGKSTLINLLLRLYDLSEGKILIDGQNIAKVEQESLRAQIGMVTQDTSLLHRSVRDNLCYGKSISSDEEMIHAAQKAHAHEFIQTLVDANGRIGYDAYVGERGVKLSGGQRQRIAIARVILKNAPILILDEATSALDSEIEHAIQENLYTLMEGKTVIAIAHRLSTIAAMDRLVVIDNGFIVEQGSHQELLTLGGLYAQLWEHQSGGFLGNQT